MTFISEQPFSAKNIAAATVEEINAAFEDKPINSDVSSDLSSIHYDDEDGDASDQSSDWSAKDSIDMEVKAMRREQR